MNFLHPINRALAAGMLSLGLLFASAAHATTMVAANLAQITPLAESGFVGKVVSNAVIETPQGWANQIEVSVTEALFGPVQAGGTITWLQKRASQEAPYPGFPDYAVGAEHLVLLSGKAPGSPFQAPMALGQGSFVVAREEGTGVAFARNEFQNATLFENLDTDALAAAVVDADPAMANKDAASKAARTSAVKTDLAPRRSGATSLDALKAAVIAIKKDKNPARFQKQGATPGNQLKRTGLITN